MQILDRPKNDFAGWIGDYKDRIYCTLLGRLKGNKVSMGNSSGRLGKEGVLALM